MSPLKILGFVLVVVGALALAFGSFSYTTERSAVKLGSMELKVQEEETVQLPTWLGLGTVIVGGLILLVGGRK